jgi:hypothetical protein
MCYDNSKVKPNLILIGLECLTKSESIDHSCIEQDFFYKFLFEGNIFNVIKKKIKKKSISRKIEILIFNTQAFSVCLEAT